jgi:hypothetical protein
MVNLGQTGPEQCQDQIFPMQKKASRGCVTNVYFLPNFFLKLILKNFSRDTEAGLLNI